jgi:hypothetical protein
LSHDWRLAKVTGENELQPDRARAQAGLSEDMRKLYQEVFARWLSKKMKHPARSWRQKD